MKSFARRIFVFGFTLSLIFVSAQVSFAETSASSAWQPPTSAPPGGMPARPVDESDARNEKGGPLQVNQTFTAGSDVKVKDRLFIGGDVGVVGVPFLKLSVGKLLLTNAQLNSPLGFCIGTECITKWPTGGAGGGDSFWKDNGPENIVSTNVGAVGINGGKLILNGAGTVSPAVLENSGGKVKVPGLTTGEICLGTLCKKSWDGAATVSSAETGWSFDKEGKIISTAGNNVRVGGDVSANKFCVNSSGPSVAPVCWSGGDGVGGGGGAGPWGFYSDGSVVLNKKEGSTAFGSVVLGGPTDAKVGYRLSSPGPIYAPAIGIGGLTGAPSAKLEIAGGSGDLLRLSRGALSSSGIGSDSIIFNILGDGNLSIRRGSAVGGGVFLGDGLSTDGNLNVGGDVVLGGRGGGFVSVANSLNVFRRAIFSNGLAVSGGNLGIFSDLHVSGGGNINVFDGGNLTLASVETKTILSSSMYDAGGAVYKLERRPANISGKSIRVGIISLKQVPYNILFDGSSYSNYSRTLKEKVFNAIKGRVSGAIVEDMWGSSILKNRINRDWFSTHPLTIRCSDDNDFDDNCNRPENAVMILNPDKASEVPSNAYDVFVDTSDGGTDDYEYDYLYNTLNLTDDGAANMAKLSSGGYFPVSVFKGSSIKVELSQLIGRVSGTGEALFEPSEDIWVADERARKVLSSADKTESVFTIHTVTFIPSYYPFEKKKYSSIKALDGGELIIKTGGNITAESAHIKGDLIVDGSITARDIKATMESSGATLKGYTVIGGGLESGTTPALKACSGTWGEGVDSIKGSGCVCPSGSEKRIVSRGSGSGDSILCFASVSGKP